MYIECTELISEPIRMVELLNQSESLIKKKTFMFKTDFRVLPISFIEPFLTCHLECVSRYPFIICICLNQFITVIFINFPNIFVQCIAERSPWSFFWTWISLIIIQIRSCHESGTVNYVGDKNDQISHQEDENPKITLEASKAESSSLSKIL